MHKASSQLVIQNSPRAPPNEKDQVFGIVDKAAGLCIFSNIEKKNDNLWSYGIESTHCLEGEREETDMSVLTNSASVTVRNRLVIKRKNLKVLAEEQDILF